MILANKRRSFPMWNRRIGVSKGDASRFLCGRKCISYYLENPMMQRLMRMCVRSAFDITNQDLFVRLFVVLLDTIYSTR